jgi:non-haem Fe2+, alpha-ketoglutarate-dependent halogenase
MNATVQQMLDGFESLDEQLASEQMTAAQRGRYLAMVAAGVVMRGTYGVVLPHVGGGFDITSGLDRYTGHELRAKGTRRQETDGGHYLRSDEVAAFERDGLLGPFRLLERSDAHRMKARALALHDSGWDGRCMLGPDVERVLRRHGQWGLDYSGMYQALRYPEWWDIIASPEIGHRMASLLGDDVICWRSQFFEKKPGARGTFWHQAGAFRETSKAAKLTQVDREPGDTNNGMLQLSMWLALEDATVSNGALRFLSGSYVDSRLEEIGNRILDHPVDVLSSLGVADIAQAIRVLEFTANDFIKSQLAFEYATKLAPDLFADGEVRDMAVEAGEMIIFTSVNMHASWPNVTSDSHRLAFGGRYTTNDVAVYKDMDHDTFPTPEGYVQHSIDDLACIQVHGEDRIGQNNIQAAAAR